MTLWKFHLSGKKLVLVAIVAVAVVFLAYLVVAYSYILEDLRFPGRPTSVGWNTRTDPNVKVRGTIEELKLNYRIGDGLSFHRFPAYMLLNNSVTLWTSEDAWNNRTLVRVGYDYTEVAVHNLSAGVTVEVEGYWLPLIDHSPYVGMIIVGPLIYGSYVKPLES